MYLLYHNTENGCDHHDTEKKIQIFRKTLRLDIPASGFVYEDAIVCTLVFIVTSRVTEVKLTVRIAKSVADISFLQTLVV